jgi:hypothetical protein
MRMLSGLLVLGLTVLGTVPGWADDGAASIAAGGLVLMKREPRIVMAKEVLRIGLNKVVVDYEFRNDSAEDITTVVAFPVPAYTFEDAVEAFFGNAAFDDFQLTVEGRPHTFATEARAFASKREITSLLAREHIDVSSFGHASTKDGYGAPSADLKRLSAASKARLAAAGAFRDGDPNWKVVKKYYWTQTFPAHRVVHIQHRYSPVPGGTNSVGYGLSLKSTPRPAAEYKKIPDLKADDKNTVEEIDSLCLGAPLEAKLLKLVHRNDMSVPFNYVDFILTTANTWKTPIEDFTLIVDRPASDKSIASKPAPEPRRNETLVSFCWNGPIERTDPAHFMAHAKNFIPVKELRVGFVHVDQQDPSQY